MTRIAIYPGSFDPPTRGHEDLVRRGLALADRLVVAVAVHPLKQPLFSEEERVALLRTMFRGEPRIAVESFHGLLADYAVRLGASVILRGLRAAGDFEYELQMALMNRQLASGIETVFLAPAFDLTYVSSSLVREVARYGGDVRRLVHADVAEALREKFAS